MSYSSPFDLALSTTPLTRGPEFIYSSFSSYEFRDWLITDDNLSTAISLCTNDNTISQLKFLDHLNSTIRALEDVTRRQRLEWDQVYDGLMHNEHSKELQTFFSKRKYLKSRRIHRSPAKQDLRAELKKWKGKKKEKYTPSSPYVQPSSPIPSSSHSTIHPQIKKESVE